MPHTPGDWDLDSGGSPVIVNFGDTDRMALVINDPSPEGNGFIYGVEADEEDVANGRLISAAPKMLAALKEALEVIGSWGEDGDPAWGTRAEAAIAKAEGRI